MKTSIALWSFLVLCGSQALAVEIICAKRNVLDGDFGAHFTGEGTNLKVKISIPVGEPLMKGAEGKCVTEEDTSHLSLRCDSVLTSDGEAYFVRTDGNQATIAKGGQVLASLPCNN